MALEYESLNAVIPCELWLSARRRLASCGGRDDFSREEVEENFMRSKEADTLRVFECSNEGVHSTNPVYHVYRSRFRSSKFTEGKKEDGF